MELGFRVYLAIQSRSAPQLSAKGRHLPGQQRTEEQALNVLVLHVQDGSLADDGVTTALLRLLASDSNKVPCPSVFPRHHPAMRLRLKVRAVDSHRRAEVPAREAACLQQGTQLRPRVTPNSEAVHGIHRSSGMQP